MGLKRDALEAATWLFNKVAGRVGAVPENPRSIFVLRNNDIGDLLVATPLFEALKRRFPEAKVVAGIGSWNAELLANNPFVDAIVPVNAPWHNHQVHPSGLIPALKYLVGSSEVELIRQQAFEIGIDFLGCPFGSWLMMRANIPWRMGVKGYAGGYTGVQQFVQFDLDTHVARAGLEFAALLGARELPDARPQLYLTEEEAKAGRALWGTAGKRIVVAPGGGYRAKCWPTESYSSLLKRITDAEIILIGGKADHAIADQICRDKPQVRNLAGQLSLRQVFSLTSAASAVICNPSMAFHVAAAFHKPCLVLQGEAFLSAREQHRLWGYPETRMLGKEPEAPAIAGVEEAYQVYSSLV